MPRFDKNLVAGVAVGAAGVAVAVAAVILRPSSPAPDTAVPEAGKQEVEAMYREARAMAEAEARAKEELRQAELQAAEEALNAMAAAPDASFNLEEGEAVLKVLEERAKAAPQGGAVQGAGDVFSRDIYARPGRPQEAGKAPQEP